MEVEYEKIFVIGFNKTATSTFDQLFKDNGLPSQHVTKWNVANYTCFGDNGNLNDFKNLDKNYPNSLFILNVRPLRDWLISRFKHGLRHHANWAYPYTIEKCKKWLSEREDHHAELLSYFKDYPEKLIIIDITKDNWQNYVADFLNLQKRQVEDRNVHPTLKENQDHMNIVNLVDSFLDSHGGSIGDSLILTNKDSENEGLKSFANNFDS